MNASATAAAVSLTLADRLLAVASELTDRALAEQYRDPFWYQRYGEPRATRHGRQDGNHHVSYLVESLRAHDPVVMERYARWLQQLLTSRGMCTRHIAECFDCLGRAITERGWSDASPALEMLAAANAALRYDGGPARAVQDRAGAIADGDPELETLASYLADAIALARPDALGDHVAWYVGFLERQGRPPGAVVVLIERLRAAALRELPEHQADLLLVLDAAGVAARVRP
jgi:hypothetical protein